MAWYRCGGGGIPSSLKGDMNDVFNKKFGTVLQDYPPEDWPGTVNLMGPLPEKNVSGSVVAFSDGADAVLLKSCAVTIASTLDGISSVDVVQTGKNLLNPTLYDGGAYNPTVDSQCTFTESATQFSHVGNTYSVTFSAKWTTYTMLVPVKYGVSYYTKFSLSGTGTNLGTSVYCVDSDGKVLASAINSTSNPQTRTFAVNVPSGAKYFCIAFTNRSTAETTLTFTEPQLEVGSSSSTYAQYVTPTTHTANLGRTIYGGSADIVNGTGTDANALIDMGSLEWTYHPAGSVYSDYFDCYLPSDSIKGTSSIAFNGYTDDYVSIPSNNIANGTYTDGVMALASNSRRFIICDTRYTSAEALTTALQGKYLSYPLDTPEDFTFTPVPILSRLGDNTMWSDGDLSVTYRRDIDLALAQ